MKKFPLIRTLLLFAVVTIFVKIYQHNQIIKLNYERQRLENKMGKLNRDCNELKAVLSVIQEPGKVKQCAQEKMGMKWLALSQVVTVTEHSLFDFYTTTTR